MELGTRRLTTPFKVSWLRGLPQEACNVSNPVMIHFVRFRVQPRGAATGFKDNPRHGRPFRARILGKFNASVPEILVQQGLGRRGHGGGSGRAQLPASPPGNREVPVLGARALAPR